MHLLDFARLSRFVILHHDIEGSFFDPFKFPFYFHLLSTERNEGIVLVGEPYVVEQFLFISSETGAHWENQLQYGLLLGNNLH